jgi:hypothetical protein
MKRSSYFIALERTRAVLPQNAATAASAQFTLDSGVSFKVQQISVPPSSSRLMEGIILLRKLLMKIALVFGRRSAVF